MTVYETPKFLTPITLTGFFRYDAEGRLTVATYPLSATLNDTTTYTTEYDALGRPSGLYFGSPFQYYLVLPNTVSYNAAGQLTAMSTNAYTETLQYNTNLQLARLTATPTGGGQGIDFTYTYPATGNNGRISQMTDNISGEQVSYTYDQLNRLVRSVSSVTGTMPFAYDGFGNLTQQGQTTLSIDATTNRINSAGYQYNANGNVTQTPGQVNYLYDVANRLVSNNAIYNPRNQRVFDGTYIYLYAPEGKLAGKYQPAWSQGGSNAFIQGGQPNVYFAGKLIQEGSQWVMTDRLGSVRLNGSGARSSYQPYGAEVTPTTSDQRTKFATYYRDSAGLDYAGQRYYSNVAGRFLTPDPAGFSAANPNNPATWNSYAYVHGDPVNFNDSTGDGECAVGEPVPCTETVTGDAADETYPWMNPIASLVSPAWTAMNYNDVHGIPVPISANVMKAEWYNAVILAAKMLSTEPDCAGLFGLTGPAGNMSPEALAVLAQISNSYSFGTIPSAPNTVTSATTTGIGTAFMPVNGATMQVSTSVAIKLNNLSSQATFVSGTTYDQAVTVLHELGHAYWDLYGIGTSAITDDAENLAASEANTNLVVQKCK